MGAKKKSWRGKGSYANYKAENRFSKNKKVKIARHAAANPNDATAQAALKNVSAKSNRWGHKKSPKKDGAVTRLMAELGAKIRGAEKAYAFLSKQPHNLILNGKVYDPLALKEEFGVDVLKKAAPVASEGTQKKKKRHK